MKTQMSNFDISTFVRESQHYVGMQVEKIFQMSFTEVWLRLSRKGEKATLVVKLGKAMWFEEGNLKSDVTPPNFAMLLRKHVAGKKLNAVSQHHFDRIVVLEFGAENQFKLVIEMFGKGNMVLVQDGVIIKPLTSRSWRHREMKPGAVYKFPPEGINPLDLDLEDVSEIISGSERDIVRTIATQLNMGGSYAEELCDFLSIDKNTKASDTEPGLHEDIKSAIDKIISGLENPAPIVKYLDGEPSDLLPSALCDYSEDEAKPYDSFNLALKEYFSSLPEGHEDEEGEFRSPEAQRLERLADLQKEAIERLETEIVEFQEMGDLIYAEYAQFEKLLAKANSTLDEMGWGGAKAELEKWEPVISFDPGAGLLDIKIQEGGHITLDVRKDVNENAGIQYSKSKKARDRLEGAKTALEDTLARLKKANKEDVKKKEASKKIPTRQMWFDRYRWFMSSEGFLVVGGRDARSNDKVVKKHLKDDGIYVHADVQGAASIVIMKGRDATEQTYNESCEFAVSHSKAWKAKLASGSAYWVKPDQVSKTPQPGEFLPRGAFMIRGKRNYSHKLELKLAIGEVMLEGERKIMCGPVASMKEQMKETGQDYFVVVPGDLSINKFAKQLSDHYNVPIEEISRILPSGDVEIIKKPLPSSSTD